MELVSELSSVETFAITPTPLESTVYSSPLWCYIGMEHLIKKKKKIPTPPKYCSYWTSVVTMITIITECYCK